MSPDEPVRRSSAGLLLITVLALVLRAPRAVNRWDEVALAYAAYAAPTSEALWSGQLGEAVASWVGLHPPLHALLLACLDGLWPAPFAWMAVSVLASVAAVWLVGRHAGLIAALVLATSSIQLQDAAEVNNYPLAVLGVAALAVSARATWPLFLVGVAAASWGHVLGLVAAGGVTAWRLMHPVSHGERARVAAGSLLVAAPLLGGVVRLTGQPSTFAQPELVWAEWGAMVTRAAGPEGCVLGIVAVVGLIWTRGAHTLVWSALAVPFVVALGAGAAAPHQRPYLGLFGPPVALAVAAVCARAARRAPAWGRVAGAVVVVACATRGGRVLWSEVSTMMHIRADLSTDRGVDRALAQTGPGDVVWLVAPALQADDDKTDHSAVLWRFAPWSSMPRHTVDHVGFVYTDWLWGQPRQMDGRWVHTSTELDAGRFDVVVEAAHAAGRRVAVVLYDHGPATGLVDRVARTVRIYRPTEVRISRDRGLGDDYMWLMTPEDSSGAHP